MPLYDFRCDACEADFEAHVAVGDIPPCPVCGAETVSRRYSAPATLRIGLRGAPARDSDARRKDREAARREAFKAERARKRADRKD